MYPETFQKSPASQELYLSLVRTMDKLRRQVEDLLKRHGLSEAQYSVLCTLKEAYPQGLSCGELGARMITRDPDITRLLDRLEQPHLIERQRGAQDRRIMYATILPAGMALLEALEGPMADLHEGQFAYLADEEAQTLFHHLLQIKRDFGPDSPEASSGASRPSLVHGA